MSISGRQITCEAVIIRKSNSGEADRTLVLFTKELGKLRITAKGVRKITSRRSGYLEMFRHIRVTLHKTQTQKMYMTEAETIESFQQLSGKLAHVAHAYYVCELIDKLMPDGQIHSDIFDMLVSTFVKLEKGNTPDDYEAAVHTFTVTLLEVLGFLPPGRNMPQHKLVSYIETITEKKLKTPKFLENM